MGREKNYERVFNQIICAGGNRCFEADSEKAFLEGNLIETDYPGDANLYEQTEKEDQPISDAYFQGIVKLVAVLEENGEDSAVQMDQLERLLTVKSCKIYDTNQYLMAPCHPMSRLVGLWRDRATCRFTEDLALDGETDEMAALIRKQVFDDYSAKLGGFYVYGSRQVYYSVEKDGSRRAIPWENVGTLTPLDAVRLMEKIDSWIQHHAQKGENENGAEKTTVRIAYIGTIYGEKPLQEHYGDKDIILDFTRFKRKPQNGAYMFERMDAPANEKKIYDLSSLMDMKLLFEKFNIVLFMDESYFYVQRQWDKDVWEKTAAEYVQWCHKELERQLELTQDPDEITDIKIYFYQKIYNKAGLWMNGRHTGRSGKLGFHEEFFETIRRACSPECDVYLYISRGEVIGDMDLGIQSVCNDERYDGKKLFVYKVSEKSPDSGEIDGTVSSLLNDAEMLASVDLWKLAKSVGKDFYKKLFGGSSDSDPDFEKIDLLKETYLCMTLRENGTEEPTVTFSLKGKGSALKSENSWVRDFAQAFLKLSVRSGGEERLPYIRNYLSNLLVQAIVARARSVKGIFYAYLMKKDLVRVDAVLKEDYNETEEESDPSFVFRARRAVYAAIRGLDSVMIRDAANRLRTLKYSFRNRYCPDMGEDVFEDLLRALNGYCEKARYTESRLYLLTQTDERGE